MKPWLLWREDKAAVARQLEEGRHLDGHTSAFGDNDLIIGFLMVEGFWSVLVETEADGLKKGNGYPPRTLNGLWALCELAGVERIAQSGKVIGDEALLRMVGFQVEQIEKAKTKGRPRVDSETLSNHLGRISEGSVEKSWWEHVRLLRLKKWFRGGVYAVDGTDITIPYGEKENYEGAEHRGEAVGYKLVVVLNIEEGKERVVGWILGGLARNEKTLLKELMSRLREQFGRLGDWMKVLVMDRAYWGAEFLGDLKKNEGVDYVVRARSEKIAVAQDMEGLSKLGSTVWHEVEEEHSRLGKMRVEIAGFQELPLWDEGEVDHGPCQGVIAEEYDSKRRRLPERDRFYYVTSLPVDPKSAESVQSVRTYYRRRWAIENQGFWVLTKRWNLDTLVARNLNAIRARLNFALQLYNAENCCAWKHPGDFEDELPRLKRPPQGERLGRPSIMVYTPEGEIGAFQVNEYQNLITTAVTKEVTKTVKKEVRDRIREGLAQGRTLDEVLRDL
ncbi:MAG: transposase [Elusimicrobiota bacterium]